MDKTTPVKGENGTLCIGLGWRGLWQQVVIHGGPFDASQSTDGLIRVCVRGENREGLMMDRVLPIVDFGVPPDSWVKEVENVIFFAVSRSIESERRVYVGCKGGYGRTGLFLALVAKACGEKRPVDFVRQAYCKHAVETRPQQDYVRDFDVSELRGRILSFAWSRRLRFWRR